VRWPNPDVCRAVNGIHFSARVDQHAQSRLTPHSPTHARMQQLCIEGSAAREPRLIALAD
jgi:hypothetical protein